MWYHSSPSTCCWTVRVQWLLLTTCVWQWSSWFVCLNQIDNWVFLCVCDIVIMERDAMAIFTKYLSLDCPCPVAVSDDLRVATVKLICHDDGVRADCFTACQQAVKRVLDHEYVAYCAAFCLVDKVFIVIECHSRLISALHIQTLHVHHKC